MNNFIFENTTKVYFGKGCVKEYLACLTKHYGDTVMLCYGGGSVRKNGIYDEVVSILREDGKNIIEFSGITPNPTYEKVLEGRKLARANQADMILGVGGGSVMDCCKAISLAAVYEGDIWENFWERPGIIECEPLPIGVIVTAAGSGSEMNGRAVLTNERLQLTIGRDYPKCSPRFALMDPEYTYSVPNNQMISSGLGIFFNIMEIYFSGPDEDNVSDNIAEALMGSVIRNLRAAVLNPEDYRARSNLMWNGAVAKNGLIRLGKCIDTQCSYKGEQTGIYIECKSSEDIPAYFRGIHQERPVKFRRFALHVWGISPEGRTEEEIAFAGIDALERFISEMRRNLS